jgi:hypothetical protein
VLSGVSIAVRDPDVRKMLMLYSEATGQKVPLSATTPQSGSLAEMGGKLYQQATYVNGTPYTFSGQGAAQFVAGQVVTPEFVQVRWLSAASASNGRLQNSAIIQQPGLVVSWSRDRVSFMSSALCVRLTTGDMG